MDRIDLPVNVESLISCLEEAGFESYIVGGGVREGLVGQEPPDWDICTAARPDDVMALFEDCYVSPNGLKHGSVTVTINGEEIEVTTFRTDGQYSDGRHADEVLFVEDVYQDLERRDFTVNAMAYSPSRGLLDFFAGKEDLEQGILRTVKDPQKCFSEDGMRIIRALRFMSTKGYIATPETAAAIHANKNMLDGINYEIVVPELMKFLGGEHAVRLLDEYRDVFAVLIPELEPMFDFDQHSPYHNRDVWQHTLATVDYIEREPLLRFTMLLHDIAKPVVATFDETGRGHFVGHPTQGSRIARRIMIRMKFSKADIKRVTTLIHYHDSRFGFDRSLVRKLLRDMGEKTIRDLMKVQRADAAGKFEKFLPMTVERIDGVLRTMDEILRDGDCYTLKMLAVTGDDLRAVGITKGRMVGQILQQMLEDVIDDLLYNEAETLISEALEMAEEMEFDA